MRSIINKIRSIKGVIRTEAYQPVRIKWYKEWLKKEDNGQDSFGLRLIYYSSDFLLPIFVLFIRFLYNNLFANVVQSQQALNCPPVRRITADLDTISS